MVALTFINQEEYSKMFEKPYLKRDWRAYNLGSGYRKNYRNKRPKDGNNFGRVVNHCPNHNNGRRLYGSLNQFRKHNWYDTSSLFISLIVFCLEEVKHKITYKDFHKSKYAVQIRQCVDNLTFPYWAEEIMEEIWASKPDFIEYLKILHEVPRLNFDLESAITVFLMQGKDAIFGILMQIYTIYHYNMRVRIKLIPKLPVIGIPKISDFVSGVFFPVVVTKFSNRLSWEENDDGSFLIDQYGAAIDCARSGNYTCANDPLFNRLGFIYRSKHVNHVWRICENWKEVTEAAQYFGGGDVLVRGLSETFMNADWHRFGPNGLVTVNLFHRKVGGKGAGWHRYYQELQTPYVEAKRDGKCVVNLKGELIDYDSDELVCYSTSEIEDWFELAGMCS